MASEKVVSVLPVQSMSLAAAAASRHLSVQRRHDAVQTEQTGGYAQDGFFLSPPSRFQTEVGSHLLEGRFDRPPSGKVFDHLFCGKTDVGREEVFVAVRTGAIVDEHPEDLDQAFGCLVPMARATDDFDVALATTVPSYLQPLSLLRSCHDSLGGWQLLSFLGRSSCPATGTSSPAACRDWHRGRND